MYTIRITSKARKQSSKLPASILKKLQKQLRLLIHNPQHPSLQTKRYQGTSYFEGRIDYKYRFLFIVEGSEITVLLVGPHDTGLGKK